MQFKDAASAARAAAESAERAASAARAAADFVDKNSHVSDEAVDCKLSVHESNQFRKRQSMSNSSRSSNKEDVHASNKEDVDCKLSVHESNQFRKRQSMNNSSRSFNKEDMDASNEPKSLGRKASSTDSFSGSNNVEDKDTLPADLDSRKMRIKNSRVARKVHSEIKFDDSEGLCSETEDENDVEIQSVERPAPPTREPFSENRHSVEEEPDHDFPELPKAKVHSCVHPNMPLDYETLTARFEALKSGKLP